MVTIKENTKAISNECIYSNRITREETESVGGSIKFTFDTRSRSHQGYKLVDAISRMVRFSNYSGEKICQDNYTTVFNNWLCGCYVVKKTTTIAYSKCKSDSYRSRQCCGSYQYRIMFMDGMLDIYGVVVTVSEKDANSLFCEAVVKGFGSLPRMQMETEQGEISQASDKAHNTIVTRDADLTLQKESGVRQLILPSICSTEELHMFDSIVNRWMTLPVIQVSTGNNFNTILKVYNIPSFLYSEKNAPNLMPFENFVYGKYDIDFKFVVNANKFHVGKLVASVKYDSYQVDAIRNDVVSMLVRPHVIMDLSANNEAQLSVPFKYHRTFVRNMKADQSKLGIKVAQYATVVVSVLSPLAAVAGAPSTMFVRPFYRLTGGQFTGMTQRVPVVQMDAVGTGLGILERALKFAGNIANMDKPYDSRVQQVVVRPRMNFQTGKGASDCVPMRLDPMNQTSFLPDHEYPEDPVSTLAIAQIWGFAGAFEWSASHQEDTELFARSIEPNLHARRAWEGVPTPLEYIAAMYQFWSGPLEFRFDFVSNAFHTGSVMISAEYGKVTKNVVESSATYTKTFHLGEQRTVSFVVPYIYDTVWRRTSNTPYCPIKMDAGVNAALGQVAVLRTNSSFIRVRVVNRLVPVTSVIQTIKVLVYVRAGQNFQFHSPIMTNMLDAERGYELGDFPRDFHTIAYDELSKVDLPGNMRESGSIQVSHSWLQGKLPSVIRSESLSDVEGSHVLPDSSGINTVEQTDALLQRDDSTLVQKSVFDSGVKPSYYDAGKKKFTNVTRGKLTEGSFDYVYLPNMIVKKGVFYYGNQLTPYPYNKTSHQFQFDERWYDLLPIIQMDSGTKEELDRTYDFSQGQDRSRVQTIESHLDIKDLLRRPVCIISNHGVDANQVIVQERTYVSQFYVPCMPPSRMFEYTSNTNRCYSPLIGRSYHSHLVNLFRFWRGSQRYTIVSHRSTGSPIYISYLPHSGAMISGNLKWNRDNCLTDNVPPSSVGLPTEMIIPSLNPTVAIEVPFETEDNWCLTWCENWQRNFSWRDKGDYNVGHLVMWSAEAFNVDVFWSAGDDFKLGNFYGPGAVSSNFSKYLYTDDYPSAQMEDFPNQDAGESFTSRVLGKLKWPLMLSAAGSVPVIGPAMVTAVAGTRVESSLSAIDRVAEKTSLMLDGLTDIIEMVKAKFFGILDITGSVYNAILNAVIDLLSNVGSWNPRNIAMSILRLIVNLAGISLDKILNFLQPLSKLFGISPCTQAGDSLEHISESFWTEDRVKEIFKLVVAVFAAICGTIIHVPDKTPGNVVRAILGAPFSLPAIGVAVGVLRFVDITFNILREGVLWVVGRTSFEGRAIQLLRSESPIIKDFCMESQILLNEANKSALIHPSFRLRYWANVVRACEIQRRLVALPSNRVSPVLMRLCADMIKHGKENMADLRSSPIKYEPFVICIEGFAGIGKSQLVRGLCSDMLRFIGMDRYDGDPIFYRIAGSRFWNGYSDQPVVVYDDFLNITEPTMMTQVLNELYQLKSCATFVPEQAAIEEKKIKATPRIVVLLCNDAFPDSALSSVVSSMSAVYRRRDLLIRAELKPEFSQAGALRSLTDDQSRDNAHLTFYQYPDVQRAIQSDIRIEYAEFKNFVLETFKKYDAQELRRVQIRMAELMKFFQHTPLPALRDPFSIFYQGLIHVDRMSGVDLLPSELLERTVASIARGLDEFERQPIEIPENEIVNPFVRSQMEIKNVVMSVLGVVACVPTVSYVVDKMRKWIESRHQVDIPLVECSVCKDSCRAHYVCRQSWQSVPRDSVQGLHLVCEACVIGMKLQGSYRCPVCRDEAEPYQIVSKELLDGVFMMARLYRGGTALEEVLATIRSVFSQESSNILLGFMSTLSIISVTFEKIRCQLGSITPKEMIVSSYGVLGVGFTSIMLTAGFLSKVNHPTPNVRVIVDGEDFVVPIYDIPELSELNRDIAVYNMQEGKLYSRYCALVRQMKDIINVKLGDRSDLYIAPLHYGRLTELELDYNKKVWQYNMCLLRQSPIPAGLRSDVVAWQNRSLPVVQSDEDLSTYRSPYPIILNPNLSVLPVFGYEFNARVVDEMIVEQATHHMCMHKIMQENIGLVKYNDGRYNVATNEGWIEVPLTACFDETCPWGQRETRSVILKEMFEMHKASWFVWINGLPESDRRKLIRLNLPKFAWPSWIAMDDVELQMPVLNDDHWFSYVDIHPVLKTMLVGLLVGTSVVLACKSLSSLVSWLSPVPQIIPSGDAVIRHFKPKLERIQRGVVSAQSEMMDAISAKVNHIYFVLFVESDGSVIRRLIGVGIKQRLGIMPRHYYDYLVKTVKTVGIKLYFARAFTPDHRTLIEFDEKTFWCSETADICVVQFGASINMFKDIVKYMSRDQDLQGKMANTGVLVKPKLTQLGQTVIIPVTINKYVKKQYVLSPDGGYYSEHCLSYNYSCTGACGSLVLKDHSQRPVVAMHFAGTGSEWTGTGYGVLLTQEMFDDFKCEVTGQACEVEEGNLQDLELAKVHLPVESDVLYLGSLPKKMVPHTPFKSKIKPSLIADLLPWKSVKEPAILSGRDERYKHGLSPLVAGCAKHGNVTHDFKFSDVDSVRQVREYQLMSAVPHVLPVSRLSITEAIVGFDGIPYYDPLHLDTSAGWPLCTTSKTLKKDYCIVERNGEGRVTKVEVEPIVLDEIKQNEEKRRVGIVPLTLFVDILKDEKRKKEKLMKLGGTRVFCASPFAFSVAMRQNFLHFVAAYMRNRWNLNHAVGINLQGPEVTELVSKLLEVGNNIVTIDYSNFGPGFNAGVAWAAAHNIKAWTLDNVVGCDRAELDCLMEENYNSAHVMHNLVYRQHAGSPSGSPITVIINSEVNVLYVMLAWKALIQVEDKWKEFKENVIYFVYGDDLIMSVSDKYIKQFNAVTITSYFAQYNIAATNAEKGDKIKEFTGIEDAVFLKCKFECHPLRRGQWIAKLDMDSVNDTPMWIKEEVDFKSATLLNAEAGVRAAYGYGKVFFDEYLRNINRALNKIGCDPILLTWDELDEMFYD